MAISDILLRIQVHAPLVTKGSLLDNTEVDDNFIEIYDSVAAIEEHITVNGYESKGLPIILQDGIGTDGYKLEWNDVLDVMEIYKYNGATWDLIANIDEYGFQDNKKITNKSATGDVELYETVCICDTSLGNVTLTLPLATDAEGREFIFKLAVAGNDLIIEGNGAETIDGSANQTLTTQYSSSVLISDGTSWHIKSYYESLP